MKNPPITKPFWGCALIRIEQAVSAAAAQTWLESTYSWLMICGRPGYAVLAVRLDNRSQGQPNWMRVQAAYDLAQMLSRVDHIKIKPIGEAA